MQRITIGRDTASEEHVEFPSGADNTCDAEVGEGQPSECIICCYHRMSSLPIPSVDAALQLFL